MILRVLGPQKYKSMNQGRTGFCHYRTGFGTNVIPKYLIKGIKTYKNIYSKATIIYFAPRIPKKAKFWADQVTGRNNSVYLTTVIE